MTPRSKASPVSFGLLSSYLLTAYHAVVCNTHVVDPVVVVVRDPLRFGGQGELRESVQELREEARQLESYQISA